MRLALSRPLNARIRPHIPKWGDVLSREPVRDDGTGNSFEGTAFLPGEDGIQLAALVSAGPLITALHPPRSAPYLGAGVRSPLMGRYSNHRHRYGDELEPGHETHDYKQHIFRHCNGPQHRCLVRLPPAFDPKMEADEAYPDAGHTE